MLSLSEQVPFHQNLSTFREAIQVFTHDDHAHVHVNGHQHAND